MEKAIENKIRYHKLYDLYGSLLTEKQRSAFEYYYLDDYSLSEIASLLNVSRNAVYEQINIATAYLEEYESKLNLLIKTEKTVSILEKMKRLSKDSDALLNLIQELEKME
jgi:predicted DNA-binding protein YlxM (UPF0122 family)